MPLSDNIVDLLHATGAGAGSIGAFLSGIVYKRFRAAETTSTLALKSVGELANRYADLTREYKDLKDSIERQFAAIARGSTAKIEFTLDPASARRMDDLEKRMSSLEDDFDAERSESKKSWEAMHRSMGRIEGKLDSLKPAG